MRRYAKHDNSLEKYKIFPYIAWGLVVGFVFFVYTITIKLTEVTNSLEQQMQLLQSNVDRPVSEITDFGT